MVDAEARAEVAAKARAEAELARLRALWGQGWG